MLRIAVGACFNESIKFLPSQYQIIRWKRKPRKPFWIGMAKSKRFIIHDEPILPPEESAELLRLHANYRTSVKSIRQYLEEIDASDGNTIDATAFKASEEEIEKSIKVNDAWNAESSRMREERMVQKALEHEEMSMEVIERVDKNQALLQQRIEEIVLLEKAKSKDFVTRENLDKKIEECLASEMDYNYAIDLRGNMFTGYETEMKSFPLDLTRQFQKVQLQEKPPS